jgi:hypothetical protein
MSYHEGSIQEGWWGLPRIQAAPGKALVQPLKNPTAPPALARCVLLTDLRLFLSKSVQASHFTDSVPLLFPTAVIVNKWKQGRDLHSVFCFCASVPCMSYFRGCDSQCSRLAMGLWQNWTMLLPGKQLKPCSECSGILPILSLNWLIKNSNEEFGGYSGKQVHPDLHLSLWQLDF